MSLAELQIPVIAERLWASSDVSNSRWRTLYVEHDKELPPVRTMMSTTILPPRIGLFKRGK
jgi:hypothetical protein